MKVSREEILKQLESVLPGLSPREVIEQSSCVVFKDDRVYTFNDEVSCSQECCLSIQGAVQAMPFVSILRKMKEEFLEITVEEEELKIKGKNKKAGIRMETEIQLPIDSIEQPKKWRKLSDSFSEAVGMVKRCASKDETKLLLTHLHITPNWIEACDNFQAARYLIETGLKKSVLVRKDSLKFVESLEMIKYSITKNWIHFKNVIGLVFSCRKLVEEYPELDHLFKVKGEDTTLPKGLTEAIERAEVFSNDNAEDDQIVVRIKHDKIKIQGEGATGWFTEIKKAKYKGKSIGFAISPDLLKELIEQHNVCQVSEKCIKMQMGKFTYIASLSKAK